VPDLETERSTRLKTLGAVVLAVTVAAGGFALWQRFSPTPPAPGAQQASRAVEVEVAPAAMRDLETVVEAVGTTRARRSVEITPLAAGRVAEINVKAGRQIRSGEVLLRLDDDIQRADLVEAEARLVEARSALKRAETLKRTSAVSESAVDKLVAALAIAEADRERAARRLRDRTVVAPFAGIVGFSDVEPGARVKEGDRIAMLDDLSQVEIEFSLPEALFGSVGPGRRILADASAFPGRTFEGVVETVDSRVDPVARAFKARARVANPDFALPAGMFMHLSVVLDARRALTVPEEALVVDGSRVSVFVVGAENRVERRTVAIGQRSFGFVEVRDGVTEGDRVVVRGVQKVRDGGEVRPRPAGAGAGKPNQAGGASPSG
jgi:membrane fusion protein (multidrug efflux system)